MKLKHWLMIAILVIVDLGSKQIVSAQVAYGTQVTLIDGFLYLTNIHNTGAAWSILEGKQFFFIIITLIAIAGILYILYKRVYITDEVSRWGLMIVFSGILGNFFDRLVFGYVRDFVGVYLGSYPFPIFNWADSCITIGVTIIIIRIIFEKEHKHVENH